MSTPSSKPTKVIGYPCLTLLLGKLSFVRRKQLCLACPALRKQENTIPYNLEIIGIGAYCSSSYYLCFKIDQLTVEVCYYKSLQTNCCVWYESEHKKTATALPNNMSMEDAAEKLFMFYMNRQGSNIKKFVIKGTRAFLPKCSPLNIGTLCFEWSHDAPTEHGAWIKTTRPVDHLKICNIFRDEALTKAKSVFVDFMNFQEEGGDFETMMNWKCETLKVRGVPFDSMVTHCWTLSKTKLPIGYSFIYDHGRPNLELVTLDWLGMQVKGRKTFWNGRKCVTITMNDSTEFNIHGDKDVDSLEIIMEYNPRGTAIDR
ncbi:hypothetical protein CRE_08406 [Caenorhabditis remanei]|uniref:F-box associated domain-containing protein n=1 Tax=Caenorhabditis remanei TaxID=31234 RepID=E3MPK5_CAERE|nr:hypothetical protein CRE_08406 [Caenorhabditis remanei]